MGFYYYSLFSLVPLGIAYGVLALIYWGVVRASRGIPARKTLLAAIGALFFVLPISEEFWIAWNFGQACKEAGTFIYKQVQVDGFYDDTRSTHVGDPTPQAVASFEKSGYRFFEMKGRDNFVRIEKIDGQWKSVRLDRPTARYHYNWLSHIPQAHKLVKHDGTVTDSETKEILGRELNYGRFSPWFFIGLDAPIKICVGKREVKGMLYENVLLPTSARGEGGKK